MIWAGHVARTGERKGAYKAPVRRPEEKGPLEGLSVDGRKIYK
jgi:hypothetical protein